MALTIEQRRRVEKSSTVAGQIPTVAPSNDYTDGSWSVTDIYERELFINLVDGKIYTREGSTIIELGTTDVVLTGMAIVQGETSPQLKAEMHELQELLGRIHNQKNWYKPKDDSFQGGG